jgi:hypothetical protein
MLGVEFAVGAVWAEMIRHQLQTRRLMRRIRSGQQAVQGTDAERLSLQPDEVDAVAWATCEDILTMVADGRFVA